MSNKMIIDASHPEETRVVVLRGSRVEEFDFESASKKPLRGNIYLAKVTRVEPSLQAAFIDYGGNRHGFLAFSEIHPDYYQIPVADRQALLEEEARSHREDEEEAARRTAQPPPPALAPARSGNARRATGEARFRGRAAAEVDAASRVRGRTRCRRAPTSREAASRRRRAAAESGSVRRAVEDGVEAPGSRDAEAAADDGRSRTDSKAHADEPARTATRRSARVRTGRAEAAAVRPHRAVDSRHEEEDEPEVTTLGGAGSEEQPMRAPRPRGEDEGEPVEVIGGDAMDETPRRAPRMRRHYKIQEVIKRRQVLLVQVVKEERGNKGAALTTYLSLAGRYSVLMPNTARGGGISRKITNAQDRSRLKSIAEELEVPEGMGVILRTAGASRTKPEVKRDFEYLLRMWETVRETTLASSAPTLVYEEGSLIKRAIRDLYSKDVEEIIVAGDAGYSEAQGLHAPVDAQSRQGGRALSRHPAGVRQGRRRGAARRDVLQSGHAEVGRLHRHQPDRGAGRDRRQLGPLDPRAQYRGHRAAHQSRGGGRDRPSASPARSRGPHRRRLHRHGGDRATIARSSAG